MIIWAVAGLGGYANMLFMGINQPQTPAGIYDASGRFIAPAQGNASYEPAPQKFCSHGLLCSACAKR